MLGDGIAPTPTDGTADNAETDKYQRPARGLGDRILDISSRRIKAGIRKPGPVESKNVEAANQIARIEHVKRRSLIADIVRLAICRARMEADDRLSIERRGKVYAVAPNDQILKPRERWAGIRCSPRATRSRRLRNLPCRLRFRC